MMTNISNIFKKIGTGYKIFMCLFLAIFFSCSVLYINYRFSWTFTVGSSFIILFFLYFILYRLFIMVVPNNDSRIKTKKIMIICIILSLCLGFFYVYYLRTLYNVKVWDLSCYWLNNISFKTYGLTNILDSIKWIIASINYDEYNIFPSFLLTPLFSMTSNSFFAYVGSVYILFVVPCLFAFLSFCMAIIKKINMKPVNFYVIIASILTFVLSPQINAPVLQGYLDIVDLIFVFSLCTLIMIYDFKKFDFEKLFLFIVCTIFVVILRRYYLFWLVGFYFSICFINFIYDVCISKSFNTYWRKIRNIFIIGVSSIILFMILFYKMMYRILTLNLALSYSAYKDGDFLYQMGVIVNRLGIIPCILILLGYIFSIINSKTRKISFVFIVNFVVTVFLFNRIQNMGIHHMYLVIPFILYGFVMLFISVIYNDRFKISKFGHNIIMSVYICFIMLNFLSASTRIFENTFIRKYNLLSDSVLVPEVRNDMDFIEEIVNYIENDLEDQEKIYTIASSHNYNSETFSHFHLPNFEYVNRYATVSNVDLNHGFSKEFFNSKYVMTITPVQYHLNEDGQRVIGILYDIMESNNVVSDNYTVINQFNNDGITVKIYMRDTRFSLEEREYILQRFNEFYVDYKELFEDRIMEVNNYENE